MQPTLPGRILVVDDDAAIRDDFRRILRPDDEDAALKEMEIALFGNKSSVVPPIAVEVDCAAGGEEAVALARAAAMANRPYAMSFVDIRMPPGWDGLETIRHLWAADPRIEVVICTAWSDHPWHEIVETLGGTDRLLILKKPFDPAEVRQLALALTTKWRLAREAEVRHEDLEKRVRERTVQLRERNRLRLRAEAEKRKLQEQLHQAQKMEAIGQLANGIAHDFSNLLAAVGGCVSRLQTMVAGDPAASRVLDELDMGVCHAREVARSLVAFCRAVPAEKEPVDLCEVVGESCRLLRHMLPAAVEMTTTIPRGKPLRVRANRTQVQQVLLNLVANARDAMRGGGKLHIAVSRTEGPAGGDDVSSGWARIVVTDTGCGMTPEVRARVFEPFFTTKPRGQGSGLGLSIVYGIVGDHHGRIEIQSEPGRGSSFTILLPLCSVAAATTAPESSAVPRGNGERILLVLGARPVRELAASALQSFGYRVVQAGDAAAAMDEWRRHAAEIGVLVCDGDLPDGPGADAVRSVRAAGGDVPAILLVEAGKAAPAAGPAEGVAVLRKPFGMAELAALVHEVLSEAASPAAQP